MVVSEARTSAAYTFTFFYLEGFINTMSQEYNNTKRKKGKGMPYPVSSLKNNDFVFVAIFLVIL